MTEEYIEQNRPTLDALWKQYENAHQYAHQTAFDGLGSIDMGFQVPRPEDIIRTYDGYVTEFHSDRLLIAIEKRYHAAKVYMMARDGDMNGAMIYKLENC